MHHPLALPPADDLANGSSDGAAEGQELTPLTGEIDDGSGEFQALPADVASGDAIATANAEDPVQRLREMIGDRQEETVEILRSWLDEKEERA